MCRSYNIDRINVCLDECDRGLAMSGGKLSILQLLFPEGPSRFRYIALLSATHVGPSLPIITEKVPKVTVQKVSDEALQAAGYLREVEFDPECDVLKKSDFPAAGDPLQPEPVQRWVKKVGDSHPNGNVLGLMIVNERHEGFTCIGTKCGFMTADEEAVYLQTGKQPASYTKRVKNGKYNTNAGALAWVCMQRRIGGGQYDQCAL